MARYGKVHKGGRPKGTATIEKEKLKDYIAQRIAEKGPEIVNILLEKALEGDIPAVKELFDRGFGKAAQAVDVTSKGESLNTMDEEALKKAAEIYGKVIKEKKLHEQQS